MKTIIRGFYHKSTGLNKKGTAATKAHADLLEKCNMDVDRYIGGKDDPKPKAEKKPAKKKDE